MAKLLGGSGLMVAVANNVQLQPLQTMLEVLAGLAGIGGLIVGFVAIYKARSDKDLNNTQAMSLLFEKQREINLELLAQRDAEIAALKQQLEDANGDRSALERRLASCERSRTVLRNQLKGLQATLDELRANQPKHPRRHPRGGGTTT